MESCCTVKPATQGSPAQCPECGGTGRLADRITVKAMLRPAALMRLSALEHRFCPATGCPVVYFGHDEVFDRDEIVVPVFQKEPAGERTVCYCFAVSEREIRTELIHTGRSSVSERIGALVKADRCACEVRNPQGTCCLGNVAAAVEAARTALQSPGPAEQAAGVPRNA